MRWACFLAMCVCLSGCSTIPPAAEIRHEWKEYQAPDSRVTISQWRCGKQDEAAYRVNRSDDGAVYSRMIFICDRGRVVWSVIGFKNQIDRIPADQRNVLVADSDEDGDGWPDLIAVMEDDKMLRAYRVQPDETLDRWTDEEVARENANAQAFAKMFTNLMKMDWSDDEPSASNSPPGVDDIWNGGSNPPVPAE
jgi:hypothetical protein